MHRAACVFFVLGWLSWAPSAHATDAEPLEEVIVTASLRRVGVEQLAGSITLLKAEQLDAVTVSHFQDVLPLIPNLNWAAGTSRPRYFQLRGIGETEQWQGAPNSSVGFLIDDIDFAGVGMPAGSFDLGQVEVLRGPQGTSHGANALAGLISVRGREPEDEFGARFEASAGDYSMRAIAAALTGPLSVSRSADNLPLLGRLSIQRHRSDGFRRNLSLDRDNTNGYDETFLRGKLHAEIGPRTQLRFTTLWANLSNGYDAFALDNSRVTRSDNPGRDAQRSAGLAVTAEHETASGQRWRATLAGADSRIAYSFDGDWTAVAGNDFTSAIGRRHKNVTQDLRWLSPDTDRCEPCTVLGWYARRLTERSDQLDVYNGDIYRQLESRYRADNRAMYGQIDWDIAGWRLSGGLRAERRSADYGDSDGSAVQPVDDMLGGQVSAARPIAMRRAFGVTRWYTTLSRGYRAGGFNIGAAVPSALRPYGPEYLWSLETGINAASADRRLQGRLALFAMRRRDQQVARSLQIDPADPLSFLHLTSNDGRGRNDGLEAELQWRVNDSLSVSASLGLLHARRADGRDSEHAPRSQSALGIDWRGVSGWYLRVDAQQVASFYFSDSHDQRARAHELVSMRLGYGRDAWTAELWVRNAFNEDYSQRGFFFGNEPPDYPEKLYVQQADPRQLGLTLRYEFARH